MEVQTKFFDKIILINKKQILFYFVYWWILITRKYKRVLIYINTAEPFFCFGNAIFMQLISALKFLQDL